MPRKLNEIQKLVARTYAGGEFDGVPPKDCGDGLFVFVMSEVEDAEDVDMAIAGWTPRSRIWRRCAAPFRSTRR